MIAKLLSTYHWKQLLRPFLLKKAWTGRPPGCGVRNAGFIVHRNKAACQLDKFTSMVQKKTHKASPPTAESSDWSLKGGSPKQIFCWHFVQNSCFVEPIARKIDHNLIPFSIRLPYCLLGIGGGGDNLLGWSKGRQWCFLVNGMFGFLVLGWVNFPHKGIINRWTSQ